MDQVKIGKFISDMRKQQGLTQKQLAEQLNVTDKTVSKWKTGYRLPDASILPELSFVLKVDINELLAGGKIPLPGILAGRICEKIRAQYRWAGQ